MVSILSKLTIRDLENEFVNWANFLHADANAEKLKITLIIWVVMVKNGRGLLGHDTLMSELVNWADFFQAHTNSGKLRITLIIIGWVWSFKIWYSKVCSVSRMYRWTDPIFCMLVHNQENENILIGWAWSNMVVAF